ncbi:reversibly glycosylated polypeptide family [Artemisia annua]|uniref:Reversibly glycosylated polypeptide family n=1 Tax=Artemisia annua TaxID=35608 RepID=A0A2U1LFJ1_ARTAN|nr:reversibly glycosylated polypeptide family [Artemisia annua]
MRNSLYVDAVIDCTEEFYDANDGTTVLTALKLAKEGSLDGKQWKTNERGSAIDSPKKEWEGVKLMEELVPFFQTLKLSSNVITAEACLTEMAAELKKRDKMSTFPRAVKTALPFAPLLAVLTSSILAIPK